MKGVERGDNGHLTHTDEFRRVVELAIATTPGSEVDHHGPAFMPATCALLIAWAPPGRGLRLW